MFEKGGNLVKALCLKGRVHLYPAQPCPCTLSARFLYQKIKKGTKSPRDREDSYDASNGLHYVEGCIAAGIKQCQYINAKSFLYQIHSCIVCMWILPSPSVHKHKDSRTHGSKIQKSKLPNSSSKRFSDVRKFISLCLFRKKVAQCSLVP